MGAVLEMNYDKYTTWGEGGLCIPKGDIPDVDSWRRMQENYAATMITVMDLLMSNKITLRAKIRYNWLS